MMTYSEARALMATCRNKANGKPIANNTRLFERGSDETTYYVIRLHNTDIIEIYSNHTFGLRHDGWTTVTTRQRLYSLSPISWQNLQSEGGNGGDWFLRTRAPQSDPEPPENNHIEIERPYEEPPLPGREPVESDFGPCWDGHVRSWTERTPRLHSITRDKPGAAMRLHVERFAGEDAYPNRARAVLGFLDAMTSHGYVPVTELTTSVEHYGEDRWRYYGHGYHAQEKVLPGKYAQCPHCAAFQTAHAQWTARKRLRDTWDENVDEYGTYDAWRSAWRDDRQRVIQANRAWRAWNERNRLPWDGLVIVNSDGFPLWSEVKAVKKAQAARRRSEIAARRARERREIEQRKLDRFKAKVERHRAKVRGTSFEVRAARIADSLSELREGITVTVSVNDSQEIHDD